MVKSEGAIDFGAKRKILQKSFLLAFVVFIFGLLATFIGWYFAFVSYEHRKKVEFEGLAKDMIKSIEEEVNSYITILEGARGLFAASKSVERDEWSIYIRTQNLAAKYPGVSTMRFIQRVPDSGKEKFIQEVKTDTSLSDAGYPDFSIKSYGGLQGFASAKPEYFVVKYEEPASRNNRELGLDVSSEPARWNAYERAWMTGEAALSGFIDYVGGGRGFIVTAPIYQNNVPASTFSEKRAALQGFVDVRIVAGDFFSALFGEKKPITGMELQVFDGDFTDPGLPEKRMIFNSFGTGPKLNFKPAYEWRDKLELAGRVWTLYFYATPEFKSKESGGEVPVLILAGGVVFSFLLWGILYLVTASRFRAVSMAREMTAELRKNEIELSEALSDARKTHMELRTIKEKLSSIIDTAYDAFISMDSKGLITAWNRQAEAIFGWSRTEVFGKSLSEVIIPLKYRERHTKGLQHFLATGEGPLLNKRLELSALHKDGREFPVELTIWFVRVEEDYYFNAFIRDITERKRAETALKEAQLQLIQAEKAASITELAAGAAHEVKNPLAIVLQGTGYLNQHVENKNADVSAVLKEMEEAVKRADYIIKGLLNLSRSTQLVFLKENLNAIIEESLMLVKILLDRGHIKTIKELDSHLPSLMLDKGKMIQVFINLLTNAIHMMPEGGNITVRTRSRSLSDADIQTHQDEKHHFTTGQTVVITEIEDTGPGISENIRSKIFDPFFTTRRTKGGTGLGLSVVRNIVEMHGGIITLENLEEKKGARAVIVLPASNHS